MSRARRAGALAAAFARCRRARRAAFVPYLTAGDPDLATTIELVLALDRAGADVVELGVPFSDPIADGPVNQAAAARALASGTTLSGILAAVEAIRRRSAVPIVLFTYFNPVFVQGLERFAAAARRAGVDGVLTVDLPPEEAGEMLAALRRRGLDAIFLLAPTSGRARLAAAAAAGSGFLYYVSRTGVTGERAALPAELAREVRALARDRRLPVAVGFGISTPEQAAAVARIADGVVVGSALVRGVAEAGSPAAAVAWIERRAAELAAAIRRARDG